MALLENVIGRGPASAIPAAGAAGALYCETDTGRVRRDNGSSWDIIAGGGTPTVRGPYVVNYTDIPTAGSAMTLWTPQVGDALLSLWADHATVVQWDHGTLYIGPNVDGTDTSAYRRVLTFAAAGNIVRIGYGGLDTISEGVNGSQVDGAGALYGSTGYIFQTSDPVQIQLAQTGGTDPTTGHVELYALVATPIAP